MALELDKRRYMFRGWEVKLKKLPQPDFRYGPLHYLGLLEVECNICKLEALDRLHARHSTTTLYTF